MKTVVIFRKWIDNLDGDILALFPLLRANELTGGDCQSYEHIGQHGASDYSHCIRRTRPATPEEYADLAAELRGIGYNLIIRRRRPTKCVSGIDFR